MLYLSDQAFIILIIFHSIGNIQATKDAKNPKGLVERSHNGVGYELISLENQWNALEEHKQNWLKISKKELSVEFPSSIQSPNDFVYIVAMPMKIDEIKANYGSKSLLFYYEIKLVHKGKKVHGRKDGTIQIGFQYFYSVGGSNRTFGEEKEVGETFGYGYALDFKANKFEIFYTKNGKLEGSFIQRGNELQVMHQIRPYARISGEGTKIETNFNGEFQYKFEEFGIRNEPAEMSSAKEEIPSSSSSSKIETKNDQNANKKIEKLEKENIELKKRIEKMEKENAELKNAITKMKEKSKYFGKCSICLNPFKSGNISAIKCGHTFHPECIKNWINTHNKKDCPECRKLSTSEDIIPLYIDEMDKSTSDEMTTMTDGIEWANYDWNVYKFGATDCSPNLTISERGLVVEHHSDIERLNTVRAILPIPALFNLNAINKPLIVFYFEMKILNTRNRTSNIIIGYCDQQFPLVGNQLGSNNSIGILYKNVIWIDGTETIFGYVGDRGHFKEGDFVGIGIINQPNSKMECFATWNGKLLGKVELPEKFATIQLFPAITSLYVSDLIRANFEKDKWQFKEFERLLH